MRGSMLCSRWQRLVTVCIVSSGEARRLHVAASPRLPAKSMERLRARPRESQDETLPRLLPSSPLPSRGGSRDIAAGVRQLVVFRAVWGRGAAPGPANAGPPFSAGRRSRIAGFRSHHHCRLSLPRNVVWVPPGCNEETS